MSRLAVVIVSYNCAPLLGAALDALSTQTHRPHRVMVVDNASHDRVRLREVIASYPEVELLELDHNTGFAFANNRAFERLGDCEFVACLNPDARPEPGWLAALLLAAQAHPEAAAFGSRMLQDGRADTLDGAGDLLTISGLPRRRGYAMPAAQAYLVADEILSPCAAAALYRLDALREVGGFDESFFCYVEDVDLGFRLRLKGRASRYVPQAIVHHIGSAVSGYRTDFYTHHGHRNLVFNFVKNMPGPLLWAFMPLHLAMTIAFLLLMFARGRGEVAWRAKREALRSLPRVWAARSVVQRERVASSWQILRLLSWRLW